MSNDHKLSYLNIEERIQDLPTLPSIVYEIQEVMKNPMASVFEVEKVMGNDPSLTTKVLKLVNSAYYSIPGGVTQLSRAISHLGFDTVYQLVLASSIVESLSVKDRPDQFNPARFWQHSLGTAIAAELLAREVHHPVPADLFTSGLIHDIGKLALCNIDHHLLSQVIALTSEKSITYSQAEEELGLPTHTQMGFLLAAKWKLPFIFQMAIKLHHQTELATRGSLNHEEHQVVDIVCLSNIVTQALHFGNSGHSVVRGAPKALLERLGLDEAGFQAYLRAVKIQHLSAGEFLRLLGIKS